MMEESAMSSASSSIGDAVSGRGEVGYDEEEDLFYIPEARPPLDTSQWHFVDPALSPAQSYKTMSSEGSANVMEDGVDESSTRVELQRADSFSSSYSFDSDDCEKKTLKVHEKEGNPESPENLELIQDPAEIRHPCLTVKFTFQTLSETLKMLSEEELRTFKWTLWTYYQQIFSSSQNMDIVDIVDRLLERFSHEESVQITKTLLYKMGKKKEVEYVTNMCIRNQVRYDLCNTLRKKYGALGGDLDMEEEKRPIDDIYVDLNVLSNTNNGPNIEHEVLTIPKPHTKQKQGVKLSVADILSLKMQEEFRTTLLLVAGVAGSGKSVLIRKLVRDWVEERAPTELAFVFPLAFRELRQFEGSDVSLVKIIHTLYPETTRLNKEDFSSYDCRMLFIFDGLDEYNEPLDFSNTMLISDPHDSSSLNVILVNLLRGRLLYNSVGMFTSRKHIDAVIPWDTHYNELEVMGFCDPQKDEFFRKRFKDPSQVDRVIEYVKSVKTLHIMCHLPLFCSLVADECQRVFREQGSQAALPRSITYVYTKLLLELVRHRRKFRAPDLNPDKEQEFLLKLGKLALNWLEHRTFQIHKLDWPEISDKEAIMNSGLCTEYVVTPYVLCNEDTVSFLHPTIQEYLAALYAFLSFRNQEKNVFEHLKAKAMRMFKGHKIMELYKAAVEKNLQYEGGNMNIFLRFLCGMALEKNQELLRIFCKSSAKVENLKDDVASLIRKKIKENPSSSRTGNLHQCLEELGV
uniref:NACHT domain-containing protein n=1 Tax=Nothobranchius pienaari TaxID=704102 RepID=A0A1A8MKK5_9TELE